MQQQKVDTRHNSITNLIFGAPRKEKFMTTEDAPKNVKSKFTATFDAAPAAAAAPAQADAPPQENPNEIEWPPLQRTNVYQNFFRKICEENLENAFNEFGDPTGVEDEFLGIGGKSNPNVASFSPRGDPDPNIFPVIIVGAGASGLVAAYELAKVGIKSIILEASDRVGGRLKTFHFPDGQHSEGGAMRLPGTHTKDDPWDTNTAGHYLTDFYANKFRGEGYAKLTREPFHNVDPNNNTKINFYGDVRWKTEVNTAYYNEVWPGWADLDIGQNSPAERMDYTCQVPWWQLKWILDNHEDDKNFAWNAWLAVYGAVSMRNYLQDPNKYIAAFAANHNAPQAQRQPRNAWSTIAITALNHSSYIPLLDASFAELYSETMGHWWSGHANGMHKWVGGMESLPLAFMADHEGSEFSNNKKIELSENIKFNFYVTQVDYTDPNVITVKGVNCAGQEQIKKGRRIILTVPLTILKNIEFLPKLDNNKNAAITDIHYSPSTKILLQFRERFWEKGDRPIRGGFSKTTDTLGQLHYPTRVGAVNPSERGILVSYTWERNALVFGAQQNYHNMTTKNALQQIKKLHAEHAGEIDDLFEGAKIQAWFSDPHACGAFVYYDAFSGDLLKRLVAPAGNFRVFFAGEGISFTHGWIQGALESGIFAAYYLYATMPRDNPPTTTTTATATNTSYND